RGSDRALRKDRVVVRGFWGRGFVNDCRRDLLGMAERRVDTPAAEIWPNSADCLRDGNGYSDHGADVGTVACSSELACHSCDRMAGPCILRSAIDHVFLFRLGLRDKYDWNRSYIRVQQCHSHRRAVRRLVVACGETVLRAAGRRGAGASWRLHGAVAETNRGPG